MHKQRARLDRLRKAAWGDKVWGTEAERTAMKDAIAAYLAKREVPANTLRTLSMTAGEFADMMSRIEPSC